MKALVTGISGFVGGYLGEMLLDRNIELYGTKLEGEQVLPHINKYANIMDVDLRDRDMVYNIIEDVRPDLVFHLAAQSSVAASWKRPDITMEINMGGTINLLDAIREINPAARVLIISSSEQYGRIRAGDVPIGEDMPQNPVNPYAVSKASQEMLGKVYADAYDMDIVMARPFNHTGPRQQPIFVIPDFAHRIALMENKTMDPVLMVGNLDAIRDFSDVRDVVEGYFCLITKGKRGKAYNIGSGKGFSIREILKKLLEMSSVDIEVVMDQNRLRPSDTPILICDNTKIKTQVGWQPRIQLDKTLSDVLEYFRQNIA